MPVVPKYEGLQVAQEGLPVVRLGSMSAGGGASGAGAQAQDLGRVAQGIGAELGKLALAVQGKANEVRVNDAVNEAQQAAQDLTFGEGIGYTGLKGAQALNRPDGKPLTQEYEGLLRQRLSGIVAGLGNDAQRQMFAQRTNGMLAQFRDRLIAHEAQEFGTYWQGVNEATIKRAQEGLLLNWSDEQAVGEGVAEMERALLDQGALAGWSPEVMEDKRRQLMGSAYGSVVVSAVKAGDLDYAKKVLDAHGEDMDAKTMLTLQETVSNGLDERTGVDAAKRAIERLSTRITLPEQQNVAFEVLLETESGKKHFDSNGNVVESKKGALGIAQVMPRTAPEAARLAGLEWSEDRYRNDPDYNRKIGQAYFQHMLKLFDYDVAKAYAAYNGGPTRLGNVLRDVEKPENAGKSWLDLMPLETRKYVRRNMRLLNAKLDGALTPTMEQVDDALLDDPSLQGNARAMQMARQVSSQQLLGSQGAQANEGRRTEGDAAQEGQESAMQMRTEAQRQYLDLTNNPNMLRDLSEEEVVAIGAGLSETERYDLFMRSRALRDPVREAAIGNPYSPSNLDRESINQSLKSVLDSLSEKNRNRSFSDGRVNMVRNIVEGVVLSLQKRLARPMVPQEIHSYIQMLATLEHDGKPLLAMGVGDLSEEDLTTIRIALAQQRVNEQMVDETKILSAYWLKCLLDKQDEWNKQRVYPIRSVGNSNNATSSHVYFMSPKARLMKIMNELFVFGNRQTR